MGIKFAENSGLNDGMWKDTDLAIRSWLMDADTEKNNYDDTLNAMFNVDKSKQFGEKLGSTTEFGDFEIVPEGGKAVQDDIQEGYDKLIVHEQLIKGFTITANMLEDNRVEDMKVKAEQFVKAYKRSRLAEATALLTAATATQVKWGGKQLDASCADKGALFSTSHPSIKGSGTQSNIFTDALGSNATVLYKLMNVGRNFVNSSEQPMGYDFDTIMLPSDAPAEEELIQKIIGSQQAVGTNNNDINVLKGRIKLIINPLWRTPGLSKKPFILMSSAANKELRGNMFYDRVVLTVKDWIDYNTYDLNFSGRYRAGCGFNAWQHIIMGGAATGSSLS